MAPLLDAIVEHVPPPAGDPAAPFAMLVAMVEHDSFLGPIATGRVASGTARTGDRVRVLHHTGELSCALPLAALPVAVHCMPCEEMWTGWHLL